MSKRLVKRVIRRDVGIRDAAACWVATHLPRRIIYWTFVAVGAAFIKKDEVVPEVTFATLLQRMHHRYEGERQ